MSSDQPHTPVSTPGGGDAASVLDTPPDSPPLRQVSDEEVAKLKPAQDTISKPEADRKPGEPRFPSKNVHGEKQCINCQETDTPQWRGSLCNACALWKRSRGTDRPLPLLFPLRKRARSPTPPSDDEDEDEMAMHTVYGRSQLPGPSSTHSSPIHPGPQFARVMAPHVTPFPVAPPGPCAMCGTRAQMAIRGRPFCGPFARSLHSQTVAQQSSIPSPRHGQASHPNLHYAAHAQAHGHARQLSAAHSPHRFPGAPPPREKLRVSTPVSHKELFTPVSSAGRPRFLGVPPGRQNLQTVYQTPVSPQRSEYGGYRGPRDPRIANLVTSQPTDGLGRRRSATVSGNGRLDELAHPSATVHLHPMPQMPPTDYTGPPPTSPLRHDPRYAYSPVPSSGIMPTSATKRLRIELSPSPPTRHPEMILGQDTDGATRPTGRRATVSGSPPSISPPRIDVKVEPAITRPVGTPQPIDRQAESSTKVTRQHQEAHDDLDIPSHREFMHRAEWLWGLMERTSQLLADMDINQG